MPKCTIMVGLPASGKSTWLKTNLKADFSEKWPTVKTLPQVISSDGILDDIASKYGMTYDEVWRDVGKFAERVFFKQLHDINGRNIYVDRTNLTPKARKRIMDIVSMSPGYTFDALVFVKPQEDEWRRRLSARQGKTIPDEILRNMESSFILPSRYEGFNEINFVGDIK